MTTIIHQSNGNKYCLVEVPWGAYGFLLENNILFFGRPQIEDCLIEDLPPGNWQLIGLASELSSWNKKEIVGRINDGGFPVFTSSTKEVTGSWTESFDSLLKHHNLSSKTTVILKEI